MTLLNKEYIKNIINNLPTIELSYEEKVYKKVQSDLCFALPYGRKTLLWFTICEGNYICLSIPLKGNKIDYNDAVIETCCFDKKLCYGNGTLCLGVKLKMKPIIVIYDIFYYKNIRYSKENHYKKKIDTIRLMLNTSIKNNVLFTNQLTFFLPCFARNFNELYEKTKTVSYDIHACVFVDLYANNYKNIFKSYLFTNTEKNDIKTFMIKKSETGDFDMYDLYVYNKGEYKYYDKAHINTITMSYALNKYFNYENTKYIDNLDIIEESEDEYEEDIIYEETNKFTYVNCVFNKYLKLWEPREIVNKKSVVTLSELYKKIYV